MKPSADRLGRRSLLRTTLRRALTLGRLFIAVGVVYVLIFSVALASSGGASFASSFPLLVPIFAVLGSMGGLIVFTNDRTKGVLEYLIAYGFSPRRLFINILLVSLALETLDLALLVGIGLGFFVATGHTISLALATALTVYSIPMSYASAAFASTVGMLWTSLSSPRSGLNSPIGLVPFVGIAPSLLTLGLVAVLAVDGFTNFGLEVGVAVVIVAGIVLLLIGFLDRFLPPERLLSPV